MMIEGELPVGVVWLPLGGQARPSRARTRFFLFFFLTFFFLESIFRKESFF
jgi:hypothetical protein